MSLNDVSIVYVRRGSDEDLTGIVALANQYYDLSTSDFLVLDISCDGAALSGLARAGDPFRYLTVATGDIDRLIEFALTATVKEKLIMIDDLAQDVPRSAYNGRNVQLVPKSFRPQALSEC